MFVRFTRWTAGTLRNREWHGDGTYQCDRVYVRPLAGKPDEAEVNIESNREGGLITMIVDKRTTDVFVMNDEGRTIDTYRWSERYARTEAVAS